MGRYRWAPDRRRLGAVLVAAAAAGLGWRLRSRRRPADMPSLLGRITGLLVRWLYRPLTGRLQQFDLQRVRRSIDRGRFMRLPAGVKAEASTAEALRVEWLVPKERVAGRHLLYLHGGGFMMGGIGSHRRWVAKLARAFQAKALHVEYRVAPEYPYPAPLDDCLNTYRWLLGSGVDPGQVILAGESAGGGLVMSTMLRAKQEGLPLPGAAICISGVFDFTFSGPSHTRNTQTDYIEPRGLRSMEEYYLAASDPRDPIVSSVFADLTGLPPLYLVAGGAELLRSDTELLAQRARECGVDVTLKIVPGMLHAFALMPVLPEARRVRREMKDFVNRHVTAAQTSAPRG